ncbi:hypothetical protein H5410_045379, partial [Solanum commersonii]
MNINYLMMWIDPHVTKPIPILGSTRTSILRASSSECALSNSYFNFSYVSTLEPYGVSFYTNKENLENHLNGQKSWSRHKLK